MTHWDGFEQADTRTWRTLPNLTQVMRLRLKKGEHAITLPHVNNAAPLTIRIDQNRQVITLRALGDRVFANGSAFAPGKTAAERVVNNLTK